MVSNPITNSLPKFASQNIGINGNLPLHRAHFSGPSGGYQTHHVYHDYDGGHGGGGHGHSHSGHGGGGKKRSIALSALTLLAFLYFLNILQNCLDEQMDAANPQVVVMAARLHDHFRQEQNRQDSGSSESGSLEERQDIEKKEDTEKNNFQRIDNYFNSSLSHNKKHKIGKL